MRIALVSDSHLAPAARAFNANWDAAAAYIAAARADLTIHLGDITIDGFADPSEFAYVQTMTARWPTPMRYLPGNHDIGDNPPGPDVAATAPLSRERLEDYRRAFGPDFWMVEADGWRIIGVDAQLFGTGSADEGAQWAWLDATLAGSHGAPLVLCLHKPLFQVSPADDTPHHRYVPIAPRQRLAARLAGEDVRAVLSGHVHQYLDRVVDGVRHIWLPSTAYYMPAQERIGEKVTGLGLLDLTRGALAFHLVCPEGVLRHSTEEHPAYQRAAAASPVGQATPVPPSPQ
jgi:3',5'-cyclic AMP phosphodiesterase CpdA